MKKLTVSIALSALLSLLFVVGCHAAADDPAGQAGELSDPVRRQNAVNNIHKLFTGALQKASGDRSNAEVRRIIDATVEKLSEAYINYPEDSQNGRTIVGLLDEMQDPRGMPALIKATTWRSEVTEDHAITAARAFTKMEVPDDKKGEIITAISTALERVTGARPVDNRMREAFIKSLGHFRDARALPALTRVATTQSEAQNFLFNRLAVEQISKVGDPSTIPVLIQSLFLFAPNNPALRMNDLAAEGLVRVGRPAYDPLLQLMRNENAEARAVAEAYLAAVRQRDAAAAEQMSVAGIVSGEATFALGALGMREALEPLATEATNEDFTRKMNGTLAMVRLNLEPTEFARVRDAIRATYAAVPDPQTQIGLGIRAQLLAASGNLFDPEMMPFYLEQANKTDDPLVDVRIVAAEHYSLLANKNDAAAMRRLIEAEPSGSDENATRAGFREAFETAVGPMLRAADECDEDIACWAGKLGDSDEKVARKAAHMLGRLGRGNAAAITALVGKLDSRQLMVRFASLAALDHIAVAGSQEAVDKIDHMRESEAGTSNWNNFSREAVTGQARLRARMSRS